ncbi:Cys-Gln thioester bond-forming surface protein [Longicatena caecimuris]|uniref:SpaA isopeptide-forming pilin-related protein n=1 Tax=Longicatena caecimuris TaxID=1796635 RepID=UPI001D024295|nr:SpaA isopeptide-forming pilin-related protein [Longicatena caecimuris]MCB5393696.1 Cys-Gln thioester bond-forming surface protein [Longicatena caecimuris]MCB5564651.1 Cys-Gln thioester bond-forming surface protein [Longicatena caecimuris]
MKTQKIKKCMSLFLAALMCVTTLFGVGTTAYAAEETDEVCLVSFPRDGDANYGGEWGHGSYTYMNGWSMASSRYTTVRAMGSYDGNICYCIEPGVPQESGDRFTKKGENFWDNYPSSYNHTISPDDIKLFIGRIFQYGYTGTISTSWRSQNEGGDKLAHAVATQLLVWETVVGERDADFNKVGTGGKDTICDQISTNHPLYGRIMSYYNSIAASVQTHSKVPSFFAKSTGKAKNIELEWDGEKYTATLTDTNNVLGGYSFSASVSGIRFSVNGNKLTITADTAPSNTVTITAEKKNSQRRGVITWTDGVYGPNGKLQDIVTYAQSVNDPVKGYLNIKVSYGSAKIVKTSEDGKVEGISFTITGNGINKTIQTGAGGTIQIDNLTPGVYTVTEQNYDKYEPQEVQPVTVVSGQVATVNFSNVLKRGDLTVTKTSEDGLNEGVKFHLSGTSLSGLAVDEYAVTDSSGKAYFRDVLIGTGYVLEEVDTAIRYVVPDNQTAAVEWNKVTNKSFVNILKKWNVTVTKSDYEAGTAQGDASLAGATYGIYKGEQLIDRYTTDANGQFTTKYYVCGDDWSVREIKPSEGYLLDESAHHIGAEAKNYTVEYNSTANDVTEQVIKGNIALIKHTDDGETQLETPEAGAEFSVYLKSADSYDAAKDSERDYLTCDENGFAETKDLPYGIYTVHQVKGWDGRELLPDFDVYIAKDGQTYRYLANNANFESYIKIVKVDAETGKVIPYAGAGFQLYRPDGSLITQTFTYPEITTIDTFYTNEEGTLITPEKLEYGSGYSLVEVFAPYGYTLNSEPVHFDVTQDTSTDEDGVTVIEVVKPNMAQKGIIKISKSGEVFSSVTEADGLYQPVFSVQGLPGAVYEITAAEDIITPDGTTRYSKGEIVDTVTTDETGLAESKPLYLGRYEIREIKAPYGMVLNAEIRTAELVYAGQEIEITETSASFYNERQKAAVSLDKVLEQNTQFGISMNGEITAVTFGLFAAEDLTAADGYIIPADGLLEILSVDENGHAVCKTDLPFGSFYLKELSTDEHYILSDEKHPIVFDYAGQDTALVEIKANDGKAIDNDLIYGEIHGLKKDEDGSALGGAVIGLFKADCTEFARENEILTAVSREDGGFSFTDVPFGNWIVREIEAPTGFVLSDETFAVTVDKDGAVIEVEIENTLIRGTVQLTKVDKDYPDNKLTGAEFAVYRDSNGNKELDADDELLGTLTETSTGVYEMSDLIYGGYFVKETKAPEGFYLDENAYYFEITEHGKTVTVENEAGKGFVNAAQVGSLKIIKTSSDNKIEGFSFRVTGPNGYSEIFTTDKNGEILIENLRIGEYVISEVSDGASAAYILPADKTASVFEGAVTKVEMHNELRDTPKTGDDSNPILWLSLLGISAVGAAALGVIGFKKRKKEDAE